MRQSKIKSKLRKGEPVLLTTLHLTDGSVFEMAALMGFDGIWMDLEHHGYAVETATNLIRAARVGGADVLARPAKGEFMRMGRLLEAGANGIMYPRCESAEEAREVVRWAKFPPLGQRGVDGGNADMPYLSLPLKDYIQTANEQTFLMVQIEDPKSLESVEEIAAVEGVDVVFLGPGDFSIAAGIPGQFDHPIILDAYRRVSLATRCAKKHFGTVAFSVSHGKMLLDMGATLLCHSGDIVILKTGLERIQAEFGSLGFKFNNQLAGSGSVNV
jgi:4-hydroxy-2-oxoheptanedioate aldolase